jgi:hypothetical protein
MKLDTTILRLLVYAFVLGFITDIFRNTLGLNTSILLLVAFLKPTFLFSISSKEDIEKDVELTIFTIGITRFLLFFWYFNFYISFVFLLDGTIFIL